METITTDIYENGEEVLKDFPNPLHKIEIKNEKEIIKQIKDKIMLLTCNSKSPISNKFNIGLTKADMIVLYNYLKNNNMLDELVTYNVWYHNSDFIYLNINDRQF